MRILHELERRQVEKLLGMTIAPETQRLTRWPIVFLRLPEGQVEFRLQPGREVYLNFVTGDLWDRDARACDVWRLPDPFYRRGGPWAERLTYWKSWRD